MPEILRKSAGDLRKSARDLRKSTGVLRKTKREMRKNGGDVFRTALVLPYTGGVPSSAPLQLYAWEHERRLCPVSPQIVQHRGVFVVAALALSPWLANLLVRFRPGLILGTGGLTSALVNSDSMGNYMPPLTLSLPQP
jgi:hypothetical protein